jgi:signal transduction histidine kinase
MIHLQVEDDGIGISKEQIESKNAFGIMGMRERANQMNGNFEINTKLHSGTEILVIVPLKIK